MAPRQAICKKNPVAKPYASTSGAREENEEYIGNRKAIAAQKGIEIEIASPDHQQSDNQNRN
jgi:hypothetical protein